MNVYSANWIFPKTCIHTWVFNRPKFLILILCVVSPQLVCLYFSYNVSYISGIIVIIIKNEYLLFAYLVPGTVLKGFAHTHLILMPYKYYGKSFL